MNWVSLPSSRINVCVEGFPSLKTKLIFVYQNKKYLGALFYKAISKELKSWDFFHQWCEKVVRELRRALERPAARPTLSI
jgi:hypothetical protein